MGFAIAFNEMKNLMANLSAASKFADVNHNSHTNLHEFKIIILYYDGTLVYIIKTFLCKKDHYYMLRSSLKEQHLKFN